MYVLDKGRLNADTTSSEKESFVGIKCLLLSTFCLFIFVFTIYISVYHCL